VDTEPLGSLSFFFDEDRRFLLLALPPFVLAFVLLRGEVAELRAPPLAVVAT
jgi:hypothetical protein